MVEGMVEICSLCEGSGLRIVEQDGRQVARPCECRVERRAARMLERSAIPKRHAHCSFENYETKFAGADRTLWAAHMRAERFVEGYLVETSGTGTGLMFVGSPGVGKTHLAVSVLRGLIEKCGVTGLFCDYRDLLKKVQDSYNPSVAATEMQILRPVFEAEVLVLDDLGASKPSEWVWDTVAHILNTRYNDRRTTIITTNFADEAPLGIEVQSAQVTISNASGLEPSTQAGKDARAAMRKETLGDRIGERMRSRLHEMCVVVGVYGADLRQKVRSASFASALQSLAEGDVPNIRSAIPCGSKAIQSGAAIGSVPPGARIDERPIAPPAPEQEDPLLGRIRPNRNYLTCATPEPRQLANEERNPAVPQVLMFGALEPMLTQREPFPDELSQLPEEPPIGRGKRGKSLTPQPKRLNNSPRKG
jgi:DNA replication protein DnaC